MYQKPPQAMPMPRRSVRLGDGEVNPDGSSTYDGAPYDPSDPDNPYNIDIGIAQGTYTPAVIPLAATSIGPPPGVVSAATYTEPITGFTPLPAVSVAMPPTPASGITSILTALFKPFAPTPAPSALAPSQASLVPAATGASMTTLLLLAALGVGAVMVSRKGARE